MRKCEQCDRKFPDELLETPLYVNGKYIDCCPICALRIRNAAAGLPEDTMFAGEMAQALYAEAVKYVKEHP